MNQSRSKSKLISANIEPYHVYELPLEYDNQ